DPADGRILAGARSGDGTGFVDLEGHVQRAGLASFAAGNTTLAVVATNAPLSREQANRLASMAHDGLARAIRPAHTMHDGDTVFVLALGDGPVASTDVNRIG